MKNYLDELVKVEMDLLKDPTNQDLLDLKQDLKEIIELEGESKSEEVQTVGIPQISVKFQVGLVVGAKYTDGRFYKATITNIQDNIYTIQFLGFSELYNLKEMDICEHSKDIKLRGAKNSEYLKKRKEKKKLRLQERIKEETKEHVKSQEKWQKFKKKTVGRISLKNDTIGSGTLSRIHK
eukprot:NODE_29_length_33183_cov_0.333666.p18 type:complete len:180 gc:universal NODE_29_length_33183_cov_0.333666:29527-30066(+)